MSDLKPSADSLITQGRRSLSAGHFDEAESAFSALMDMHPDRFEGFMGMADARFQRGDHTAALHMLPHALQREPRCLPAYRMLAALGLKGGAHELAIQWLEHAAMGMPDEALIFEWLVPLYAVAGQEEDLGACIVHYARLRSLPVGDIALAFARNPLLPEDVRRRITSVVGFR